MDILNLAGLGLIGKIGIFAAGSAVVWIGGVRLARGADALADKAGFGHAYVGIFLLGLMVSLPEMTFSSVAAARGNAELAVNGLLGGIGMTMVVIAITDYLVNDEPLSVDIQRPVVMFEGAMVILMLTVAAAGIVAGDTLLPAVGLTGAWTLARVGLYEYCRAFAAAGLRVRACQEPLLTPEAAVTVAAERLPEANRVAWVGLPGVVVWDLEKP